MNLKVYKKNYNTLLQVCITNFHSPFKNPLQKKKGKL